VIIYTYTGTSDNCIRSWKYHNLRGRRKQGTTGQGSSFS